MITPSNDVIDLSSYLSHSLYLAFSRTYMVAPSSTTLFHFLLSTI